MRDRIEVSFTVEFKRRTVEAVGTAFGDNADNASGILSDLRTVVVRDYVELAHRVRIGDLVTAVAQAGHIEAAVEIVRDLADEAVGRTIDEDLDLLVTKIVDGVHRLNTRNELEKTVYVAVDERQIIDFRVRNSVPKSGACQIDERDVARNGDCLGRRAGFEYEVEFGVLHNREDNAAVLQRPEPGRSNGNLVRAYRKELLAIGAIVLGHKRAGEIRVGLGQGDRCVGNYRSGGVRDGTKHSGSTKLRGATATEYC